MSAVRLVAPAPVLPYRSLDRYNAFNHNASLRVKWSEAIGWLRRRPGGSAWILDTDARRKT